MNKTNLTLHLLNAFIGCLSITILGLIAHCVALKDKLDNSIPPSVKATGMSLLFWPGAGGIVDMLFFIFLWTKLPTQDVLIRKRKQYLNGLLFVSCFIFGRPLVTLIYTFVEWGRAVKNEVDPRRGYATVETWACAYSKQHEDGLARALYTELQTARYLLIPILVLGAIFWPLMLWRKINSPKVRVSADVDLDM